MSTNQKNIMKKKVIIDTDPGVDDAMAIALAWLSPDIELVALTTVFGNVSVDQAASNACVLLDQLGADIPVARGAKKPLKNKLRGFPDYVHGKNGFGDIDLPESSKQIEPQSAADYLIERILADPYDITIVTIGPLTNLAIAIEKQPEIMNKVKEIVVLGGAFITNGNVNPAAEANMISDPHAADFVFSKKGPITVLGLDVTQQVIMNEQYLNEVHNRSTPCGEFLRDMTRFYLDFHRSGGVDGLYTHDPSAIAYLIEPDLFSRKKGEIRVATEGIGMGQTIMNRNGDVYGITPWSDLPKHNVCLEVNSKDLLSLYKRVFTEAY